MNIGVDVKRLVFSVIIIIFIFILLCFFGCSNEEKSDLRNTTSSTDAQAESSTTNDEIYVETKALSSTTNDTEVESTSKNQFVNTTSQSTNNEKFISLTTNIDGENGIVLPEDAF